MPWHAIFKDDSVLDQYDDLNREILFRKVLDQVDDLKALSIRNSSGTYTVSLLDGMFNIYGKCLYILDTDIYPPDKLENIRPIYFQRWQHDFNVENNQQLRQKRLFTAIGFQAIFDGRNVKRYLEVYDSGDIKVRER